MKGNEAFPSKYWRAADLEQPVVVVIDNVTQEMIGEGEDKQLRTVMSFVDGDKQLILNKTNWITLEGGFGEESDDWRGQKIRLVRERVEFKGKSTFGVRVRLPAALKAAKPKAASQPVEDDDAELAEREAVLSEADAEWENV
jgi:hypothetical protein